MTETEYMKAHEYKTTKTQDECVKELQQGKAVKATDLMSAMGIKVYNF
ncbi:MAG: hypothetical protein MJZ20_02890 [Bacteroidaceae bacterium]|nr:hypothetical protein [Bacteroidaceae bacterium]